MIFSQFQQSRQMRVDHSHYKYIPPVLLFNNLFLNTFSNLLFMKFVFAIWNLKGTPYNVKDFFWNELLTNKLHLFLEETLSYILPAIDPQYTLLSLQKCTFAANE